MERDEQITFIEYCDWNHIPVYHVPNGGKRGKREAIDLKRQGVKPGVPDLCIPIASHGYHGLYIELKYGNNKTTDEQDAWLSLLNANGYHAIVCRGCDDAIAQTKAYLYG